MAAVKKRVYAKLIPEECDRHANRIEIYRTRGNRYHVNFRGLQIRLSKKEFLVWREGFIQAREKLGDRMLDDHLPEVK